MDLILWRHAEAEDGAPDSARQLTKKGRKQAQAIATWLKARMKKPFRLVVSPTVRTQQTAQALSDQYEVCAAVGVGTTAESILQAIAWPAVQGTLVLVGHQPTLGNLAALLLCGQEADWTVKKGAVWWFSADDNSSLVFLRAVIAPQDT